MTKTQCARCAGNGYIYRDAGIGIAFRLWREKCGMLMNDASQLLGVSQPYLSLLERGERRWTPELLRRAKQMLEPSKIQNEKDNRTEKQTYARRRTA